ncbi:MAG TPA: hypothetical protein GXZ61_00230 [Clostridiales bacterium]|jgi:hypothetical protein|nr:hypothetical protein [Clostridiales bacterium]
MKTFAKKLVMLLFVAVVIALFFGCEPMSPTPSPTGGANGSPGLTAGMSPDLSPDMTPGEGGESPAPTGDEIPNFMEGTVVDPDTVPEIVNAVKAQYPNAQIQSVTHALHLNQQVYEVTFLDGANTNTVFVTPSGQLLDQDNQASPT